MATQPRLKRMRGGAVAEFSEAQQVQRKSKPMLLRSQVRPPAWTILLIKKFIWLKDCSDWVVEKSYLNILFIIVYYYGCSATILCITKRILRTVVQISFSVVFGSSERNQPSAIFSADSRWWWWAELSWAELCVLRLAPANLKYSDESERRVFSR